MSQKADKKTRKIIKKRNRGIAKLLNKWLFLFVLCFTLVTGALGDIILNLFVIPNQLEQTLQRGIEEYCNVSTGFMYNTFFATNLRAIVIDAKSITENADDYLKSEGKLLATRDIYVISPDGIIRHSSLKEMIGRNVDELGGEQVDLKFMVSPDKQYEYYENIRKEGYLDETKTYYGALQLDEDNTIGKKGWILVIGYEADEVIGMFSNISVVYCKSAMVGGEGSLLLLEKEPNEDGTYPVMARQEEQFNVNESAEEEESIPFPIDEYAPGEVFSYRDQQGEDYYAKYQPYSRMIIVSHVPRWEVEKTRISMSVGFAVVLLMLSGLLSILLNRMLKRGIVRPIRRMNTSLEKISGGDLSVRMDVADNREFSMLSDDINIMVLSLKRYIREAEGRIDRELALAKTIQSSAVPNTFPPYPDRDEFQIFASMDTAREVGGDFYDFFFIDDDHFAIVIADVSDKGIPAAMFMMQAKARIHARALQGGTPAQILYDVNNSLCDDNEAKLFITIWLAVIELSTGRGVEVNAGHEHPALYQNGTYRLVKYPHSPPAAVMKDVPYANREFVLQPGERLLVYTDGVTDAVNAEGVRFGDEGLISALNSATDRDPEETVATLRSAILSHAGDTHQFDDITICAFSYLGINENRNVKVLEIPAEADRLNEAVSFVCDDIPSSDKSVKMLIRMAVEEIFINIASYAYPEGEGMVSITRELIGDPTPKIILTFYDSGFKYNPLDKEDPDITLEAKERRIGGLGIFLVKEKMDEMTYTYEDGKNVLRLVKKL